MTFNEIIRQFDVGVLEHSGDTDLARHAVPRGTDQTARRTEALETFKANAFDSAAGITNKWMPMKPGTQWTYEGSTVEEDGKIVPRRIEVTTTDLTKVVGGVCTTVSYDVDYTDHELVEAEITFYAQDKSGNVWLLGNYPEESRGR